MTNTLYLWAYIDKEGVERILPNGPGNQPFKDGPTVAEFLGSLDDIFDSDGHNPIHSFNERGVYWFPSVERARSWGSDGLHMDSSWVDGYGLDAKGRQLFDHLLGDGAADAVHDCELDGEDDDLELTDIGIEMVDAINNAEYERLKRGRPIRIKFSAKAEIMGEIEMVGCPEEFIPKEVLP